MVWKEETVLCFTSNLIDKRAILSYKNLVFCGLSSSSRCTFEFHKKSNFLLNSFQNKELIRIKIFMTSIYLQIQFDLLISLCKYQFSNPFTPIIFIIQLYIVIYEKAIYDTTWYIKKSFCGINEIFYSFFASSSEQKMTKKLIT